MFAWSTGVGGEDGEPIVAGQEEGGSMSVDAMAGRGGRKVWGEAEMHNLVLFCVLFIQMSLPSLCLLALGSWLLALVSWLLALGSWLLALGSWLLALGSWVLGISLAFHEGFLSKYVVFPMYFP